MLGKRTRPGIVGKLPDPLMPGAGGRLVYPETITSPKCSLEFRIVSPRSLKNSDPAAGVGLGIVAAMEKSGGSGLPAKSGSNAARSSPIPINFNGKGIPQEPGLGGECMEESYTRVTSHRPNKQTFHKVYYDNGENIGPGHERIGCDDMSYKNSGIFDELSPRNLEDNTAYRMLDFLSSCYMCRKTLHGKDIYMYRGEKAFCSVECRCKQIAIDEHKENCGSEVSRSLDVSNSPYSRENIFFTGIIAA